MANLTKNIGTVTLTGVAEKITLPASYGWVWVKNMSEGDIFAGLSEDISEGADGVLTIPSGECGRIQADGFRSVYLMGTGNALVIAQNYADCPFKSGGKGGELPVASTDVLGGVMVDGTSIIADEQGVISAVGGGVNYTQYGTVSPSDGYGLVYFPIPFKNPPTMLVSTVRAPTQAVQPTVIFLNTVNTNGFSFYTKYYNGSSFSKTSPTAHWIAIGEV